MMKKKVQKQFSKVLNVLQNEISLPNHPYKEESLSKQMILLNNKIANNLLVFIA